MRPGTPAPRGRSAFSGGADRASADARPRRAWQADAFGVPGCADAVVVVVGARSTRNMAFAVVVGASGCGAADAGRVAVRRVRRRLAERRRCRLRVRAVLRKSACAARNGGRPGSFFFGRRRSRRVPVARPSRSSGSDAPDGCAPGVLRKITCFTHPFARHHAAPSPPGGSHGFPSMCAAAAAGWSAGKKNARGC